MRAFLLAAGKGTRLRPLTNDIPKALVEVAGSPMIEYPLSYLHEIGVDEVRVNVHYQAEKLVRYLKQERSIPEPAVTIQDETEVLLDSGGGLAKAANWMFQKDDLAIYSNADVLFVPDFMRLCEFHFMMRNRYGTVMTMAMVRSPDVGSKFHGVAVENDLVTGFIDKSEAEPDQHLHWASLQLVEKEVLNYLEGRPQIFSVKDIWRQLAEEKKLAAFVCDCPFQDMGETGDIETAEARLRHGDFPVFQSLVRR